MTPQEQEAFARGRLQGLREMDEAYKKLRFHEGEMNMWMETGNHKKELESESCSVEAKMYIEKLRQEYQQPN